MIHRGICDLQCLYFVRRIMIHKERLFETFSNLVARDSSSFEERAVCDYIKSELDRLDIVYEEDEAGIKLGGNAGNLYAYIEGEVDFEPILFSCHMDTVEPAKGKKAVLHADGRITSAGDTILGADDFGGIAAILEAVKVAKERNIKIRPIELLFPIAEEVYCKGIREFEIGKLKSKSAYILDMTGELGEAANQAPTIVSFQVSIYGRAAHAGFEPQKGIHSIKALSECIAAIECGSLEFTNVNIGKIGGGLADNIIPEYAYFSGEIRSFYDDKAREKLDEIKEMVSKTCQKYGTRSKIEEEIHFNAYKTPEDSDTILRFRKVCKKLGILPKIKSTFGGSDNNFLSSNGLEGIVVASAMYQCHGVHEYTHIDDLSILAEMVLELMRID